METLRSLPQPLAGRLAKLYTKLLDIAVPKLRRVARKNLSFALPQLSVINTNKLSMACFGLLPA